jgi:plastocyanin
MRPLTVFAWMLLAVAAVPAGAGVIRGTVAPASLAAGCVVYLDSIPPKVEQKLARPAPRQVWVSQRRSGFVPSLRVIALGDTVRFLNRDRRYHNVFSVSPTRKFDLGKYAPGQSLLATFDRAGAVPLFCELHSEETGMLFVAPNHAFARLSRHGTFALPKLPAGTYVLKLWHPRFGEQTREVEVPRKGDVQVSFRVQSNQAAARSPGATD